MLLCEGWVSDSTTSPVSPSDNVVQKITFLGDPF